MPLHAMVSAVGHSVERPPHYEWNGLARGNRPFVVVQATIAGAGQYTDGTGVEVIGPGRAMLAEIPSEHEYSVCPNAGYWEFAYAVIYGEEAMRVATAVASSRGPVLDWPASSRPDVALYELASRLTTGPRPSVFELSSLVYALLMAIAEPPLPQSASGRVAEAAAAIRRSLHTPISVDNLASAAGLSRFHFSRLFAEQTGLSPARYLQEARIERATGLLATSDRPVKEVAAACGYQSAGYFCRAFKVATGLTPSEYRTSRGGYSSSGRA